MDYAVPGIICVPFYMFFDKVSPLHSLHCSKIASWWLRNYISKKKLYIYNLGLKKYYYYTRRLFAIM